jgi:hypothetical protein
VEAEEDSGADGRAWTFPGTDGIDAFFDRFFLLSCVGKRGNGSTARARGVRGSSLARAFGGNNRS